MRPWLLRPEPFFNSDKALERLFGSNAVKVLAAHTAAGWSVGL
jgi:hypothetical protein